LIKTILQHGADSNPLANVNLSAAAAGGVRPEVEHIPEPEMNTETTEPKVETNTKESIVPTT